MATKRIEKKTVTRKRWKNLTPEQISEYSKRTGVLAAELEVENEKLAGIKKEFKERKREKEAELKTLHQALKPTGEKGEQKEIVEEECTEVKNFTKGTIHYVAPDGTIFDERKMTDDEVQTAMQFEEKKKKRKNAKDKSDAEKNLRAEAEAFKNKKDNPPAGATIQ